MDKSKILSHKISTMTEGLTFDDVLLFPEYTDIKRDDVVLETRLHKNIKLRFPVISSPMDTVTEGAMAQKIAEIGGLGIVHRNMLVPDQAAMVSKIAKKGLHIGAAVGAGADLEERTAALIHAGVSVIVVDSAHGYSKKIIETVHYVRKTFPQAIIMAGNIATREGAVALVEAGADILRVGMGPGSICTTRIVTGMGVPQLMAITEAVIGAKGKATIVADGGIRQTGDIAKAFAFGADAVMLGSLLAGYDESPGEVITIEGRQYKTYRGMGSASAMQKGGAERYGQKRTTEAKKLITEGVEGLVAYRGAVEDYFVQIEGSLRSSFYYLGVRTIPELFSRSRIVKISRAGLTESHPHTISITNTGGNYRV